METHVHRIPWIATTVLVVAAVTVHTQHQHGAAASKLTDAQKIARASNLEVEPLLPFELLDGHHRSR
jgi:hypothetical protein